MTNTNRITKKDMMKVLADNPNVTVGEILNMVITDHSLNDEIYAAEQKALPLHMRDGNKTIAKAIKKALSSTHFPKSATEICNRIAAKDNITTTPNKVVAIMKSMFGNDLAITSKEVEVTTKRKVKVYSI